MTGVAQSLSGHRERVDATSYSDIESADRLAERDGEDSWWWRGLAVLAVVLLVAVNLYVARTATAPRTPWDEIGPLQMARVLAGQGPVAQMSGAGYYPGWGIVLTPIWWFTQDAATVYRIAVGVGIACSFVTIWPATCLVRRLAPSTPQAIAVSALALLLPGRTVNADYALSENLLTLCFVVAVLAAFRLWERPTVLRALCFLSVVTFAYLVHVRGLALVAAAAVWIVLLVRKNWRVTVVGLAAVVAGYELVSLLVERITVPLLLYGFGQGTNFVENIRNLEPGPTLRIAASQIWGQLAGSLGIVAVGAVVVAVLTWREVRYRHGVGPYGFLSGFLVVGFATSVVPWAKTGPQERLDAQVYTRYLDPLGFILVLLGLAIVFRVSRRSVLWAASVLALLDVAVILFKVAPWANTWGSLSGPANSAGILAWARLKPEDEFPHPLLPLPGNENEFWFWPSLCVLVVLVGVILLRRHVRIVSGALLACFVALSVAANPSQYRDAPWPIERAVVRIEEAAGIPAGSLSVDFDVACQTTPSLQAQALNWSGFWLSPREVQGVDPRLGQVYDSEVVIACSDWEDAPIHDAMYVRHSDFHSYRVWILPGQVQDEMIKTGLLLRQGE